MLKSLMALLMLTALTATSAFAADVIRPLPHKTTLKNGHGSCNLPQGKYKKQCAPTPHP